MRPTELPNFEAHWWPVQLETVPGSGECITVAIVLRARHGQASVRQAIPPNALHGMFGSAGKGMALVVGHTVLDVKRQLDDMIDVEALDMPFGGIRLGSPRDCVARDVHEAFDLAMRMSTAFSLSAFGRTEEKPDAEASRAFDEWAEQVRLDVLHAETADRLRHAFQVNVKLGPRKKVRVGFLHGDYLAQFGVLRAGPTLGADQRALKLKLFDVETLRREKAILFGRAELLVGIQTLGDTYPQRQREALAETWDFVSREASARGVTPVRCASAHDAGRHLLKTAA